MKLETSEKILSDKPTYVLLLLELYILLKEVPFHTYISNYEKDCRYIGATL